LQRWWPKTKRPFYILLQNGQLKSSASYKNNYVQGLVKRYHQNGQLKETYYMTKVKPVGVPIENLFLVKENYTKKMVQ